MTADGVNTTHDVAAEEKMVLSNSTRIFYATSATWRMYRRRRERRTSSDSMVQPFMAAKTWMCGMAGKQNVYWFCHSAAHCSRRSTNESGGDGAELCKQTLSIQVQLGRTHGADVEPFRFRRLLSV